MYATWYIDSTIAEKGMKSSLTVNTYNSLRLAISVKLNILVIMYILGLQFTMNR